MQDWQRRGWQQADERRASTSRPPESCDGAAAAMPCTIERAPPASAPAHDMHAPPQHMPGARNQTARSRAAPASSSGSTRRQELWPTSTPSDPVRELSPAELATKPIAELATKPIAELATKPISLHARLSIQPRVPPLTYVNAVNAH